MAAKKKSVKKAAKKTTKKAGAKKAAAKKTTKKAENKASEEGDGKRGRKAVLVGDIDSNQSKRMRRALRARGVRLSDLKEGETITVKIKGENMIAKHGDVEVSLPA
jgi:hypothetical protein